MKISCQNKMGAAIPLTKSQVVAAAIDFMAKTYTRHVGGPSNFDETKFNDSIYLLTFRAKTSSPRKQMDAFEKANFQLMRRISRRVDRYLPYQHAGFYFVDHDGSEIGKARSKSGLHIHALVVVHPAWKKRFEAAFDARGFSGEIHMEKLKGSTADVQRVTEYACKGVLWRKGFVKGGYDEFSVIGPKSDWKDGSLQVVKPRRHNALTVQSASAS